MPLARSLSLSLSLPLYVRLYVSVALLCRIRGQSAQEWLGLCLLVYHG